MNRILVTQSSMAAALLLAAAPLAMAAGPSQPGWNAGATQSQQTEASPSQQSSHRSSQPTLSQSGAHERWEKVATPPKSDVKPFERAKLSLTGAIDKAQQQRQGKPLEARFEMWHGTPAYFIRTYANDQVWEGRINADTGQLIGPAHTMSPSQLHSTLKRDVSAAQNAQTSLTDAVDKAQQKKGGKAIMASIKPSPNGSASYDLDLVKNGKLHTAMVNAGSGQLR